MLKQRDTEMLQALENSDTEKVKALKVKKNHLRDITEPLKAMTVASLQQIRDAFPDELKSI